MSDIGTRTIAIFVEKLGVDESQVTPAASFINDLGADPLDVMEVVMDCEKEFNVPISDDQAKTLTTAGRMIAYLESAVR